MPKHAGGRPTKYGPDIIPKVNAAADLLRQKPEAFLSGCGVAQLADALGVCTDTVYEWAKVHPEFSEAVKMWTTTRDATLYKLAKTLPPAIWIFMCKNMLGWGDKQEIAHSGSIKTADKLIIEVVHTRPEKVEGGNGNGGNGNGGAKK